MALATQSWQKALLVATGAAMILVQFGMESSRGYWFIGALAVLAVVKEIRLPSALGALISQLAAASYMSYLAHPVVLHLTKFVLPTRHDVALTLLLTYFGTLAAGLAGALLWQQISKQALDLFRRGKAA
jgi:predicted PurR-regulated permease PerM